MSKGGVMEELRQLYITQLKIWVGSLPPETRKKIHKTNQKQQEQYHYKQLLDNPKVVWN